MTKFEKCINIVLHEEGGFVNHPKDPGGATNFGVTKSVYEAFIGKKVTVDDIKRMKKDDVYPIYEKLYWNKVKGDDLPAGVDLVVVDFAVNAGVSQSIKTMQRTLGVVADGILGPRTLSMVKAVDPKTFINAFSSQRETFYRKLKGFPTFGKGWLRRVEAVKREALKLA